MMSIEAFVLEASFVRSSILVSKSRSVNRDFL